MFHIRTYINYVFMCETDQYTGTGYLSMCQRTYGYDGLFPVGAYTY